MDRILLILMALLIAGSSFAQKSTSKVEEIIFVFKTHFDNGYTDYSESVLQNYSSEMMQNALKTLEKSKSLPKEKQFVWTIAGYPMTEILRRCSPELKPRIDDAIKNGWFAVHSLPVTFETEASDQELLVRGFDLSSNLARQHGLELPIDAKLTDVPSHSWFLPTLLNNAGVKFLHLGCNPASQSPEVPLLFWWEGPDGSRLMTMYWGASYGTTLVPPDNWPYKTWLAIIHTNDNEGPPKPEDVEKVLEKAHQLAPNARLRIGKMADFYNTIIKENPDLPVVKGDMPDTWIHGYMSMPREVKSSRNLHKDLFALEALNSSLNLQTTDYHDIGKLVSDAVESSLLFDEHTFGMAMSHGQGGYWCYGDEFKTLRAQGIFKPLEDSWKEKADRAYQAERVATPTYNRQLRNLVKSVNVPGHRIVVYNSLAWERSGLVTIQAKTEWEKFRALKDVQTGELVDFTNEGNVIRFVARNVPSFGYKTYIPVEQTANTESKGVGADEKNNAISNEFFRITVDLSSGSLKSVRNLKTNREFVDQTNHFGFGQYLYERFPKDSTEKYANDYVKNKESVWSWAHVEMGRPNLTNEPYQSILGGKGSVRYEKSAVSVSAILSIKQAGSQQHEYYEIITLYKGLPYVEIKWSINSKPAEPWPEAGWLSFPFNLRDPVFKVGRLGGIVDPTKDFVKNTNSDYYFFNTGVAITDKSGSGFGITSPDVPAISLDRPGLWKFSRNFMPKQPSVFFNLYNNQWGTNFTEWIEGSWSTRFYLWDIDKFENAKSLVIPSEEFRSPLKGVIGIGYAGDLPSTASWIKTSMKGVQLSSFYKNPEGEGYILRLWEQSGESGNCTVEMNLAHPFTRAIPVNLREQFPGSKIDIKDGKFDIQIKPYQPVTLLLQ